MIANATAGSVRDTRTVARIWLMGRLYASTEVNSLQFATKTRGFFDKYLLVDPLS